MAREGGSWPSGRSRSPRRSRSPSWSVSAVRSLGPVPSDRASSASTIGSDDWTYDLGSASRASAFLPLRGPIVERVNFIPLTRVEYGKVKK